MTPQRVLKGYNGRRKNGVVYVCSGCAVPREPGAQSPLQEFQSSQMLMAGVGLALMVVVTVVLVALRGH